MNANCVYPVLIVAISLMQWVVTTILQWMLKELIKLCYMDGPKNGILEMLLKILKFHFAEPVFVAYLMQFLAYQVTAMFFAHLSFFEVDNVDLLQSLDYISKFKFM